MKNDLEREYSSGIPVGIILTLPIIIYGLNRIFRHAQFGTGMLLMEDPGTGMLLMEDPPIGRVVENIDKYTNQKEIAFSFYVLWTCAHAYAMRQQAAGSNEWTGLLQGSEIVLGK